MKKQAKDSSSKKSILTRTEAILGETGCRGPMLESCPECDNYKVCSKDILRHYTMIPLFVTEHYMRRLSPSAWKVLSYLACKATWEPSRVNYGRCRPTYGEISVATGVKASNMAKYVKELQSMGLIEHKSWPNLPEGGQVHQYVVLWFKRLHDFKAKKGGKSADDDAP